MELNQKASGSQLQLNSWLAFFYLREAFDFPNALGSNIVLTVDILSALKDGDS